MLFTNSAKVKFFHPFVILLIAFSAAILYSIYAALRFSGDKLLNQYFYVAPIVIPFVIFLLDRTQKFRQRTLIQWNIDFSVTLTAMWRVIGDVPYVSGHTLFLTYCIFSINFTIGKILAAIVLIEVLYLKIFVWNDWISAVVGIILGTIAAILNNQTIKAEP
jgi:hypothetical protein